MTLMDSEDKIYLVGDVKYTDNARLIYESGSLKAPVDFLQSLQSLMEEFGVVKIDVAIDAFKFIKDSAQ